MLIRKIKSIVDGIRAFETLKSWSVCFSSNEEKMRHRTMCDKFLKELELQLEESLYSLADYDNYMDYYYDH